MPKRTSKPAWILPNVLHGSTFREQTVLVCTSPGLRAAKGAAVCGMFMWPLDVQVELSTLICLRPFVVCSGAGDGKRRACDLDRPLLEPLPGLCKLIMSSKTHPCTNWFTSSLSLLNCKLLGCRSHLSYVSTSLVSTQWLGHLGCSVDS